MVVVQGVLRIVRCHCTPLGLPVKLRSVIVGSKKHLFSTSTKRENENKDNYGSDNNNEADIDDIKISILNASLEFVPQYGWSRNALASGAEKIGYPGVAHGMFPQGAAELVDYFYYSSNRNLEEQLKTTDFQQSIDRSDETNQEFLRKSLEARLRMVIPYLNKWPQAMAIMSIPQNIPTAVKNLCDLVDTIWFYAGDKSADLHWYGRRMSLSAIYKATELCLVQDSSADYTNTWLFLDRRMMDYVNARRFGAQIQDTNQIVTGGLITIRNMLGIGRINR